LPARSQGPIDRWLILEYQDFPAPVFVIGNAADLAGLVVIFGQK
jgi:hypothetical protein